MATVPKLTSARCAARTIDPRLRSPLACRSQPPGSAVPGLPDLELVEAAADSVVGDAELERVRDAERELQPAARRSTSACFGMRVGVLVDLRPRRGALVVPVQERGRERVPDAGLVDRLHAVQVRGRALPTDDDADRRPVGIQRVDRDLRGALVLRPRARLTDRDEPVVAEVAVADRAVGLDRPMTVGDLGDAVDVAAGRRSRSRCTAAPTARRRPC